MSTSHHTPAHAPIHPGTILLEEFLKPLDITQYKLAATIHVPRRRVNEIVHGTRGISPDTALRFSRAFGTSAQFWLNLQTEYDLEVAHDANAAEFDDIALLVAS